MAKTVIRYVFEHPTDPELTFFTQHDPETVSGFQGWMPNKEPLVLHAGMLLQGKRIVVILNGRACGLACQRATGAVWSCTCSGCSGKNHGVARKLPHELTPEEDAALLEEQP